MRKILIAEDDPASRELLLEILSGQGYEVVEAHDGTEALDKIEQTNPDLVLMDIQMPGLDGFGVLSRLRENPRFAALPVVALTAYAMREDRERTRKAGFTAHLTKPVNGVALRDQLQLLLAPPAPI